MNKTKWVFGITGLMIIGLSGYVFYSLYPIKAELASVSNQKFYEIDGDNVPSIGGVIGRRDIRNITSENSENVKSTTYYYKNIQDPTNDLKIYRLKLAEEYRFINVSDYDFTQVEGSVMMAANSKDEGRVVRLTIDWEKGGYQVKVEKGLGTVSLYDEEEK